MIELDPENNEDHRCMCGSKKVKAILFCSDPDGLCRIYCQPCYEEQIWQNNDCTEDWGYSE